MNEVRGEQPELRKTIEYLRPFILWAELAALLHDIGKLSSDFLKYRQEWRRIDSGWTKDPHDQDFLGRRDKQLKKFPDLERLLKREPPPIPKSPRDTKEAFIKALAEGCQVYTIGRFVAEHTKPKDDPLKLLSLLKAADGKDAALDRNNPLFTADQVGQMFNSNVFGYEPYHEPCFKSEQDLEKADEKREELYSCLNNLLQVYLQDYSYQKRKRVQDVIKGVFDSPIAFSDTTRPDNDTSLWEHSYAVASIFKVLLLHRIIYGEVLDDIKEVRFGILGVGWDGLAFLSQAHKIGDISGRTQVIEDLSQEIKQIVEYEFCLGNCVYEDANSLCFIIPAISIEEDVEQAEFDQLSDYGKLLQGMMKGIGERAVETSHGDLQPKFYMIQDTRFMTQIVRCMEELKKKARFPVWNMTSDFEQEVIKYWPTDTHPRNVCPICLRRPIEDDNLKLCGVCRERRGGFLQSVVKKAKEQGGSGSVDERLILEIEKKEKELGTPFISDIVQANRTGIRRVALIVAKFDLRPWLDGRMVRSLFVTEAHGLEREVADLGNTVSFASQENKARQLLEHSPSGNLFRAGYDYQRIKKEVDLSWDFASLTKEDEKEYACNTVYLYDRRIIDNQLNQDPEKAREHWKDWLSDAVEEHDLQAGDTSYLLYNILCSKTPTPSTILDVWHTTEKFFIDIYTKMKEGWEQDDGRKLIELKERTVARVEKPKDCHLFAAYEATVAGKDIELAWLTNELALVIGMEPEEREKAIKNGAKIAIGSEILECTLGSPSDYLPVRVIMVSPDLFLAIVPADKTLGLTRGIYQAYLDRFGKVMGRLPLSIGNIFFKEKTPMFVVLDSARRMVRNFNSLAESPVSIRVSREHGWLSQMLREGSDDNKLLTITLDQIRWPGGTTAERSFLWHLPYMLGGSEESDYYHPYLTVGDSDPEKSYAYRKNYFRTIAGDVVHFSEVQPGDVLRVYPNYYDFEFLDSTARRYDLNLGTGGRRKSNVTSFLSKPYLLDELEQGLYQLWEDMKPKDEEPLMPGLTDTQLRNLENLWLAKLREWRIDPEKPHSEHFIQWANLVVTTLKRDFPEYANLVLGGVQPRELEQRKRDLERLKEVIVSGLFFDCLELHMRILKERVGEKAR